ncbi:hypothetical protein DM02DRAFT_537496 [Periconia macrospinosa]|uniref:WD40 repeat-like protein n=1 Tax=Periconia macrospinosa TaxID=97972 RepID=A0A2V1DBE9_9PLEO|nr:hypothetical protein DM02DRAFT_537496 [Periconia macrospinosa]
MNEYFRPLYPSLNKGATNETRLQQHRRRLSLRDSSLVISTAVSSTGWLATATMTDICLYDLNTQDRTREFKPCCEFAIKMMSKHEKVRAVAISDHLLAVVTHYRLLVYEYREGEKPENILPASMRIDVNESWTPKSVAILQAKSSSNMHQTDVAWVAVGGEGVNGVKLFMFSKGATCWTAHRNHRITLTCHSATSSIRNVGFSQYLRANRFIVFGVTSDNRLLCWEIFSHESLSPTVVHGWEVDKDMGQNSLSHRAEITSVSIFESPCGRPYIFCAVNQKHGSQQLRTFLTPLIKAPINIYSQAASLPETVVGRHVLAGAATTNGRFLVTVEEGKMKLLTLRGSHQGGLTCLEQHLDWNSSLRSTIKDLTGISLFLKEGQSRIEITAVDGRGHLAFATVSVPCMPISAPLALGPQFRRMTPELSGSPIMREPIVGELSGDAIEDVIVVGLS